MPEQQPKIHVVLTPPCRSTSYAQAPRWCLGLSNTKGVLAQGKEYLKCIKLNIPKGLTKIGIGYFRMIAFFFRIIEDIE